MLIDHLMQSTLLFKLTLVLYLAAGLLSAFGLLRKKNNVAVLGRYVLAAAWALNTMMIVDRWFEADRAPFKTLYETMLFYPWCVSFVYFLFYWLYRLDILTPFAALVNFGGFAYAGLRPDIEIINLPPALQSAWFVPHVVTYFISYAALFSAFSLAVLYLKYPAWNYGKKQEGFEALQQHAMEFGFVTLTFGLVMGAFWGKVAWGDYWAWDPKENWALITWFIYLIAIHLRFIRGWKGKRAAVLNIVGFAAVIFTYLGMSLLPTAQDSLHVYQ